jgi:hypothetical protein
MEIVTIESDTSLPDLGLSIDDALRYSFRTMLGDWEVQQVVVRIALEAAEFVPYRRWRKLGAVSR